ncbi:hypothetical protein F4782DRAFT_533969 [Xylaria castorea]|nr:hypothetical protein F4782DRAFT_533969 [Xylaria castorea]
MKPSTELREAINNDTKPGVFEFRPQKRYGSLPLPRRVICVSREKPYVPVEIPTRSISLESRISGRHHDRSRLLLECWPEPITQGFSTPITPRGEGYDSDEEDKWNGVPIRYSHGQCRPFQKSMRHKVEADFLRLKQSYEGLSATLCKWESRYMEGRRLFLKTMGLDWTEPQWTQFLFTEKSFFDLQDKLFALQDKMERKTTQMYLFMEHVGPSLNSGVWLREEATLWSLEGAAEQKARRGEYPVLEWRGVDYNVTERTYEHYENFSSLA